MDNKTEKKRGRPPKEKKQVKIIPPEVKKTDEEELILFLPASEESDKKNAFTANSADSLNKKKYNLRTLTDISPEKSEEATESSDLTEKDEVKPISSFGNNSKLYEEIRKRDALITSLKMKLREKSNLSENTITRDNKKSLLNLNLISINKGKINIVESTNMCCWWCTYQFDTMPVFLPDRYYNKVYYVFGNFCSFSCVLAYNDNLDDHKKNIRKALIAQFYCDIFNTTEFNIKPSPQRELLEKFGGPLSIITYRASSIMSKKSFRLTLPPIIPLLSNYEEITND